MFCTIVLLAGCGSEETVQTQDEIIKPGNTTEMLNADQTESLRKVNKVYVNGLTSITDQLAENFSNVPIISLTGLTSLTDQQAESLSNVKELNLNSLTTLTDSQAEDLSKVEQLHLFGLTSITDKQAEILSKVQFLEISETLQTLIDKYKNYSIFHVRRRVPNSSLKRVLLDNIMILYGSNLGIANSHQLASSGRCWIS